MDIRCLPTTLGNFLNKNKKSWKQMNKEGWMEKVASKKGNIYVIFRKQ
jgi:hypothetical protein